MTAGLDGREIARYLGYGRAPLPPGVAEEAARCIRELERTVVPHRIGRRLSAELFTGESRDLARHLAHSRAVVLYAITLGAEADRLMRRWSAQSMARAAVGQACCAAWLDALSSDYGHELARGLAAGEYLTPPFSPGYGDWPLAAQRRVLGLLDAHRRIGLGLTEGGMLVPEKSVTALVGISDRPEEHCGQKCLRCQKQDCPYRMV